MNDNDVLPPLSPASHTSSFGEDTIALTKGSMHSARTKLSGSLDKVISAGNIFASSSEPFAVGIFH